MVLMDDIGLNGSGDCVPYPVENLHVPFHVEKFIDFMDIHQDGLMLLGSSNLMGKVWNGSLWCFVDSEDAPNSSKALTGHGCTSSISCGRFLGSSTKVVIGDDTGSLLYFSIETVEDRTHFIPQMSSTLHDKSVSCLDTGKIKCFSGGYDTNVIVTDASTLVPVHKYDGAHTQSVTGVSLSPSGEESIFASSSQDGSIVLWDDREAPPATVISENCPFSYTCLVWKSETEIVVGMNTGHVKVYDIRSGEETRLKKFSDRPIHNLCWNGTGHLGITSDTEVVCIWSPEDDQVVHEDRRHRGIVSALAWHPLKKKFYSGGYDQAVFSHTLP